jgi:hypothetical protein
MRIGRQRQRRRRVRRPCLTLALRRYGPLYAVWSYRFFYDAQVPQPPRSRAVLGIYLTSAFVDSCVPVFAALAGVVHAPRETARGPNPSAIVGRPISPVLLGTVTSLCAYSQVIAPPTQQEMPVGLRFYTLTLWSQSHLLRVSDRRCVVKPARSQERELKRELRELPIGAGTKSSTQTR